MEASARTKIQGARASGLRVLVVDDERANRIILRAYLRKQNHIVLEAENGKQALEIFEKEKPDLILMDVMMPEMNGYEATRAIKSMAGQTFVPVIFLTAATDDESLAKCIECGGDDFLTKPYSVVIVEAKIQALWRLHVLTNELRRQHEQLDEHHKRLQHEHEFAERIFAKIVQSRQFSHDGVRMHITPMGIASGDLVLAAKHPIDGRYVMVGDFTGHGLSAALGAIPVADIFYGMTAKGLPLPMVVAEINRKLCEKLPTGFFMAACFVYIDDSDGSTEIWVGGIPDVYVVGNDGRVKKHLTSRHLALGVDKNAANIGEVEYFGLEPGERIYIYTDGVVELQDRNGAHFGQQRFLNIVDGGRHVDALFDDLFAALTAYRGGAELRDDLTLVELRRLQTVKEVSNLPDNLETGGRDEREGVLWRANYELMAAGMRDYDLVQWIGQILDHVRGLGSKKASFLTVLAELTNNAVDHGVLKLKSETKSSEQGFTAYYARKDAQLQSIREGFVSVELEFRRFHDRREFWFSIRDSGPGFDTRGVAGPGGEQNALSGRGILLARSLCERVEYNERGNEVEGVFRW